MKNGHDMVKSLKLGKLIDIKAEEPTRDKSTETDPVKKAEDQKGLDIKYEAELNKYMDRRDVLAANDSQMFAVIKSKFCTKVMIARLEEHPECATKIEDNPFEMLEAIKVLIHDPVRSQYYFVMPMSAMRRVVNNKQGPNEPLMDYIKRTKQDDDVFESFFGRSFLDYLVEQQPAYRDETDPNKQAEMKKNAYKAWQGFMIVDCADQNRYGQLQKQIQSQFLLGQNQYADSIEKGTEILANHKIDAKCYELQKKQRKQAKAAKEEEQTKMTSFAQTGKEMTCYCCGKKGHKSTEYRHQNSIPKKDWWFNKFLQNYQEQDTD